MAAKIKISKRAARVKNIKNRSGRGAVFDQIQTTAFSPTPNSYRAPTSARRRLATALPNPVLKPEGGGGEKDPDGGGLNDPDESVGGGVNDPDDSDGGGVNEPDGGGAENVSPGGGENEPVEGGWVNDSVDPAGGWLNDPVEPDGGGVNEPVGGG